MTGFGFLLVCVLINNKKNQPGRERQMRNNLNFDYVLLLKTKKKALQ